MDKARLKNIIEKATVDAILQDAVPPPRDGRYWRRAEVDSASRHYGRLGTSGRIHIAGAPERRPTKRLATDALAGRFALCWAISWRPADASTLPRRVLWRLWRLSSCPPRSPHLGA